MSKSPYICYYEHIAKLSQLANKQTLFLAHLLSLVVYESECKQNIVTMTAHDKRRIMKAIGCDTSNPAKLANQYLSKIGKAGLIKSIGGGAYMVDPASFSGFKYIKKQTRDKAAFIYESRVFTEEDEGETTAYIITEDGERIDLT